jgi:cytochrome c biogenesis protein CcmG/thiol:disulfide interchange protein DsbE
MGTRQPLISNASYSCLALIFMNIRAIRDRLSRASGSWLRLAVLTALFVPAPFLSAAPRPDPLLHKQAPAFLRPDLSGHPVDLAALHGHVVLLTFWATWCAPCQIEMPRFIEWQARYGSAGLQIVGVSMDDDSDPVERLIRKRKVNYPILMGDEKLGALYGGILGLPITYLIDRQGVIQARFKGETRLDAMEHSIQKLLAVH